MAIRRLKAFEPEEGYYLCFSGGKDSQCIYHLAKMAGVKFDAHYAVTGIDPPELVQHIKRYYPDVIFDFPKYSNGGRITMWNLIVRCNGGPTRKQRFCCTELKESGGKGRVTVTGVRWAESRNRAESHGVVDFQQKALDTRKKADEIGATYRLNKHGYVVLNDDNDEERRMVEQCYRTRKTLVNPIIDWEDEDVWDFIKGNGIPYCCLYDEGFTRLGCIGCPLGGKNMKRDFNRWPKFKALYEMAFERMLEQKGGIHLATKRIAGTRRYEVVEFDKIPDIGKAYFDCWTWVALPEYDRIPDYIFLYKRTGKSYGRYMRERYDLVFENLPDWFFDDEEENKPD